MQQFIFYVILLSSIISCTAHASSFQMTIEEVQKLLNDSIENNVCLDLSRKNLQNLDLTCLKAKAAQQPLMSDLIKIATEKNGTLEAFKRRVYHNINLAHANLCGANLSGLPFAYVQLSHVLCNENTNFTQADFTFFDFLSTHYKQSIDFSKVKKLEGAKMYRKQAKRWLLSNDEKLAVRGWGEHAKERRELDAMNRANSLKIILVDDKNSVNFTDIPHELMRDNTEA
ncbi:MAG TPA: hypothetical protein VEK38_01420 [Candidatus Bathyarchaeia archaeon]|nr:hypothetical protein [Candidatus Bathyarchaeia archaeon]